MEVCHAPLRYTCMYLDVYILFFFKEWYQYAGLFPLLCIWIVFLFLVDSGSQHWQHRPRPDVLCGDGCVRSHAGSRAETRERLFTRQREKQGRNPTREIIKDPQDLRNKITEVYVTDSYAIESWLNYSPMGICIQSIFWNFIFDGIFIPPANLRGYIVVLMSVQLSVRPHLLSATPLRPLNRISWNFQELFTI